MSIGTNASDFNAFTLRDHPPVDQKFSKKEQSRRDYLPPYAVWLVPSGPPLTPENRIGYRTIAPSEPHEAVSESSVHLPVRVFFY